MWKGPDENPDERRTRSNTQTDEEAQSFSRSGERETGNYQPSRAIDGLGRWFRASYRNHPRATASSHHEPFLHRDGHRQGPEQDGSEDNRTLRSPQRGREPYTPVRSAPFAKLPGTAGVTGGLFIRGRC